MPGRVLVTGGAGFIGSNTVAALVGQGLEVRELDALRPPVHPPGTRPALPKGVELSIGAADDPNTLREALRGVDAVLHLAAYQDYLPDFSTFYRVNTVGTALLYEIAVADKL